MNSKKLDKNILIIDDELGIRQVLKDILTDEGYNVEETGDGVHGLSLLSEGSVAGQFDIIILDVWLPSMGGIEVLEHINNLNFNGEIIMISGHASVDLAVRALKFGAFDFLEKPLSLDRTITVVRNAIRQNELINENRTLRSSLLVSDEMIGSSPQLDVVRQAITQSAKSNANILISGENGTGKELIAKQIHLQSNRLDQPFVEVNCAAIPENLIESELFGHEKGAFTDAISRRQGKFETADRGTLFLDEIGDMSLATQAKILRVIEDKRFERVGGEQVIKVDVRLIVASNKNLVDEVKSNRFREDLFFRLNVIPIIAPNLRDRNKDIPELLKYFLCKFANQSGKLVKKIEPAGIKLLLNYHWPGNIRELKNFAERATIMAENSSISLAETKRFLGNSIINDYEQYRNITGLNHENYLELQLSDAREKFERNLLLIQLEKWNQNVAETAKNLGISPANLHNKLKKLKIKRPQE